MISNRFELCRCSEGNSNQLKIQLQSRTYQSGFVAGLYSGIFLTSVLFSIACYQTIFTPTLSMEEEAWVNNQVRFMMGDNFNSDINKTVIINREKELGNQEEILFPPRQRKFYKQIVELRGQNIPPMQYDFRDNVNPTLFVQGGISNNRIRGTKIQILWSHVEYHHPYALSIGTFDPYKFEDKISKIVFRGQTTGHQVMTNPHGRFHIIKNIFKLHFVDVGFFGIVQLTQEEAEEVKPYIKEKMNSDEILKFKYQLCLEGNDISTMFTKVLQTNSVAFHPYPFRTETMYYQGVEPWVHFIPLNLDASDIQEKFEWAEANPDKVKDMIKNANAYMKNWKNIKLYRSVLERVFTRYVQNLVEQ